MKEQPRSQSMEESSMLITEPQNSTAVHKLTGLSTKNYQVYMVEDCTPPTQFHESYSKLPPTVQYERIVANVITSLSTSNNKINQKQHQDSNNKVLFNARESSNEKLIEKWTHYLKLVENKALVSDCFWYVICKFFHAGKYPVSEAELQKRIGKNYIGLFLSIEDKKQSKLFFKEYFNTLAQSVFYSFFYAFPKSRVKFDDKLKDWLLTVFSQMFTGIEISNKRAYYQRWTLDLGTGNILAKKTKKTLNKTVEQQSKPKINFTQEFMERMKKRDTLSIRYSPIVDLYLKDNKYKTRNYVSEFKMKYTQLDKNKQQVEARFAHFKEEAARIQEWSQVQKEEEQKKRIQLQNQIKALKRQTINHHRRLDRRKAEQLERGAHQYANYLVSMLNAGITMTSLGVIRKNPV